MSGGKMGKMRCSLAPGSQENVICDMGYYYIFSLSLEKKAPHFPHLYFTERHGTSIALPASGVSGVCTTHLPHLPQVRKSPHSPSRRHHEHSRGHMQAWR
jgi:hypothetical protein